MFLQPVYNLLDAAVTIRMDIIRASRMGERMNDDSV